MFFPPIQRKADWFYQLRLFDKELCKFVVFENSFKMFETHHHMKEGPSHLFLRIMSKLFGVDFIVRVDEELNHKMVTIIRSGESSRLG